MKKKKKILLGIFFAVLITITAGGGYLYKMFFFPFFDVKETVYIYIGEQKDFNELLLQLQSVGKIKNIALFKQLANSTDYPSKMKTGRYAITPEINCKDLLQNLSRGNQTPCKLTFNNIRLKEDLAKSISSQLMFNHYDLLQRICDSTVCASFGFDVHTIGSMFIPNTYDIYWNISVDRFLERMKKEYDRFWTNDRLEKARQISLFPVQISILASIVEEETILYSEYPIVAGLYINRLKKGMLLQADPTVKYALGDFSLKRILNIHLEIESPYNTYLNSGLPPGPIRIPSVRGIDAVLNHTKHNYLNMCAKEDFSGRHNFAVTLSEHNRNANKYRTEQIGRAHV